ncbi:MAG: hypothetical protein A2Z21_00585 [Candidatus Fraserbacteria bacterium RBG_16_55_9]|uniref:Outer membrane protein beta-barrel domain-containing protein n=1 Tax=Fraserbacteria sp. (strain RBG_16_55_9) TaxID=1817864 RepID=A0A1F5UXF2_FRAXR|nr:MAG: hypothetical protein A2Z21_00585 [Candidatus Fraserbacteria bacterium RBG_16_55_9]
MRTFLVASVLAIAVVAMMAGTTSAQLGAGIKLSQTLEAFVAYHAADNLMLEAGLPLGGLGGFFLVLAIDANAKLFFDPIEVAQVPLRPYLGAGITIASVFNVLVLSPHALAGVEYHLQDTSFSFFGELGAGVTLNPIGIFLGATLGARYDF